MNSEKAQGGIIFTTTGIFGMVGWLVCLLSFLPALSFSNGKRHHHSQMPFG
jgi:hypothetical protein